MARLSESRVCLVLKQSATFFPSLRDMSARIKKATLASFQENGDLWLQFTAAASNFSGRSSPSSGTKYGQEVHQKN